MLDVKSMKDDELVKAKNELWKQRMAIKEEMAAIQNEQDLRGMEKRVDTMTDREKNRLAQILAAKGIESKEAIGKPNS